MREGRSRRGEGRYRDGSVHWGRCVGDAGETAQDDYGDRYGHGDDGYRDCGTGPGHHEPDHRRGSERRQVLSALREAGGDLQALLGSLTLYPQKLINVPLVKGFPWKEHALITSTQREVEAALDGAGRVLLRASGTEPLLRVMVEGRDADKVLAAAEKLAAAVREAVSS